ncbi:ATP-binding cassette domain-containing protein [Shigella flexneri]
MALLGENGAGKSTLIKALTGVYHADRAPSGWKARHLTEKYRPCTTTRHRTVYQEVNLLPNMSVADNLFIGREPKRFGFLRRKRWKSVPPN